MLIVKYLILILLLWGIPSFFSFDESIGSKFSILLMGLLFIYYVTNKKRTLILPFIILGLMYFIISGMVSVQGEIKFYINDLIKYFIIVVCGAELARETSEKELFIILTLGAISILVHAFFFQGDFGRYSGFYLDPNGAGFICLIAYSISFSINPKLLRLMAQFLLTVAGLLTFSRTFILLWLLVSLIALIANRKNTLTFGLGFASLIIVFTVSSFLRVDTLRINALENLLSNSTTSTNRVLKEDSRFDTWSKYYEMIIDEPVLGNGYRALGGIDGMSQGVHNAYLMVLGEAGIFPFLIFTGIYIYMIFSSLFLFNIKTYTFLLSLTISSFLLTTHNYFDNFIPLFVSLWLYIKISNLKNKELNLSPRRL